MIGWDHPMTRTDEREFVIKPEVEWTANEDKQANNNSNALNAIFNAVDANQFKLISTCEMAK